MPTPQGAINTSQFWNGETVAEPAETTAKVEDDGVDKAEPEEQE